MARVRHRGSHGVRWSLIDDATTTRVVVFDPSLRTAAELVGDRGRERGAPPSR